MKLLLVMLFASSSAFAAPYVGVAGDGNGNDYRLTVGMSGAVFGAEASYTERRYADQRTEAALTAKMPLVWGFSATAKAGITDEKDAWLAGGGVSYAITKHISAKVEGIRYTRSSKADNVVQAGVNYSF